MIRIDIETGNAAFTPDPNQELARILRQLADRIEYDGVVIDSVDWVMRIRDANGNTVGNVSHVNGEIVR